ncbi:MAG: riboflavin biosynthesis protein RibD [Sphingobacteriales bacterium 44-15]|nr:MAG: riboflavin biosynthesis protein RibD [Sphingobacteriales bacterium 44-15]
MERCLQLAALGAGNVAPNPMVGAILVYNDRIIGEGYHQQYGKAHAEVNCIAAVKPEDKHLIPESVLYVSLEPCAHHGKTPPCADLIIAHKIPEVVIGCRDPFPLVNGRGIEKLMDAGVKVVHGVCEAQCKAMNRRFFIFHAQHRPYIILKWAQSVNGIIGSSLQRIFITNEYTGRMVHKWRTEEAAIMVGTHTALQDDPALTARHWPGKSPVRIVIDMNLMLPPYLQLFDRSVPTIVFNMIRNTINDLDRDITSSREVWYYQVTSDVSPVQQVLHALYHLKIQSVLVEGGAKLIQSFAEENAWDEARVITNEQLYLPEGLKAPEPGAARLSFSERLLTDRIDYYRNPSIQ